MNDPNGFNPRNGKAIGVTSEALVLARLVELGYGVSLPFGDNLRYDLIVDDGQELTRAQVKTGRLRSGSVVFAARSLNPQNGVERGYIGQADDFLVYCPETNEIYRIPVDECGLARRVSLRVDGRSRSGRPVVYWAKDCVVETSARLRRLDPLKACATVHPDTPPRIAETRTAGGGTRRYCKECNLVWCRQARARKAAAKAVDAASD